MKRAPSPASSEAFTLRMKKAAIRVTQPRLLVLDILARSKYPVSIKTIMQLVKKSVDQVTVYRTLQSFIQVGIVNQIDFRDDCAYFELKDEERDHHHIVCVDCKKVEDAVGCEYELLAPKVLKQVPTFAKIINHSFEFFGVCKACVKHQ